MEDVVPLFTRVHWTPKFPLWIFKVTEGDVGCLLNSGEVEK